MKKMCYMLTILYFLTACNKTKPKDIIFEGVENFDFDQCSNIASQKDKDILFYFTSAACLNCRIMEKDLLIHLEVQKLIHEDFIFVPLSVDDRTIAEKKYWKPNMFRDDSLKRIGIINSQFQIQLTRSGSQPFFAIVSKDKKLTSKIGFVKDENVFLSFLRNKKI